MMRPAILTTVLLVAAFTRPLAAQAVSLSTVFVGDAGNVANTDGRGSVAYTYSLGTHEVNIGQYATFLNTVATLGEQSYLADLWQGGMATDGTQAGIARSGAGTLANPYQYTVLDNPSGYSSANRPIGYINWFRAARFANWINNGATASASTEIGAYNLNGATTGIFERQSGASWWIPSQDEWYKAAYYKGGGTNAGYWDYPTQSNIVPGNTVGSAANQANYFNGNYVSGGSPPPNQLTDVGSFTGSGGFYGTFDQAGNVLEWTDTTTGGTNKVILGGSWSSLAGTLKSDFTGSLNPDSVNGVTGYDAGFRLATSVPEPALVGPLTALGLLGLAAAFRHRRRVRRAPACPDRSNVPPA